MLTTDFFKSVKLCRTNLPQGLSGPYTAARVLSEPPGTAFPPGTPPTGESPLASSSASLRLNALYFNCQSALSCAVAVPAATSKAAWLVAAAPARAAAVAAAAAPRALRAQALALSWSVANLSLLWPAASPRLSVCLVRDEQHRFSPVPNLVYQCQSLLCCSEMAYCTQQSIVCADIALTYTPGLSSTSSPSMVSS
jgi:hypothetical protein